MFVLMEEEVLRKLRSLVGWTEGDGIFCPGGSISNMYAMNTARYWAFPNVKKQGLWAIPRLAIFTSQQVKRQVFKKSIFVIIVIVIVIIHYSHFFFKSHYSMKKAVAFLGIGTENVFIVKTDERYGWFSFIAPSVRF